METDTKRLLMSGLELASKTWVKAQKELGWKQEELDHFVLHQVSKVHTESLAQTLGLEADKIFTIFSEFGNIGPASVPITLAKSLEKGRIKRGDRIALMGIGSGLNCAMAEIAW
jgi:3-oxoacyl-[acyl-carrier-protein] synthase-3